MDPNPTRGSQPGQQPDGNTKPEERPLTDNERHLGPEQDQEAKIRRSNQAGDQDVVDAPVRPNDR